jgi:4-amino-4-deoxy-L-arabinose transferase-like glycosyltransferase
MRVSGYLVRVSSVTARFTASFSALPRRTSLFARLEHAVQSRPSWQWAVFFLCCVLPALACAYWRPITSDEQFTYEIARLGGVGQVWQALRAGADFHPPLDFLLRHFSMKVFGGSEIAFRLPSILAMWMALACIFAFVSRRTSALYGLIAALIPLSTPVFEYAYDGRGYAVMIALAAGALVSWQRSADGSRLALVPLAVSLAALVWAHYYGILVFLPIVIGELVRAWQRRRVDWGVGAALAAAGVALLPLFPFILAARQFGGGYWTKVGILQAVSIYSTFMERLCIPAAMLLAVLLATGLSARSRGADRRARRHEIAAIVALLLLPFVGYILAKAATGALIARYVLPTALGITIALAFAAWEAIGASAASGLVVAAGLAVSALAGEAALVMKQRQLRGELNRDNLAEIARALPGPIVMTDNDLLMQLWHYLPPEVAGRLVYVADERIALEVQGYNTIERLFPRLAMFSSRVNVQPYADFIRDHKQFLLVDNLRGYMAKMMWREGATMTARTAYRDRWVFQVDMVGNSPLPE